METKNTTTIETQNPSPTSLIIGSRLLFVISLAFITFLALTPLEYQVVSTGWDKLNHLAAFLTLALLLDFSYPKLPFNWCKFSALMCYGVGIEAIQSFLPFRYFSLMDVLADLLGIILYLISVPILKKIPGIKTRW